MLQLFIRVCVAVVVLTKISDAGAQPSRLFRAEGEHQCQSRTSIGHKCVVAGTGYTSCDEARRKLTRRDCCPRTKDKGNSINFRINTCTWWH